MANNPYADIDDDQVATQEPLVAPEPITIDRGEPTTKIPKKNRKTGMIAAVVGVIAFTIIALGMFGYFFYNAMLAESPDDVVIPSDPALEPVTTNFHDLGKFKEKVKQEEAARAELENAEAQAHDQAQADAAAGGDTQNTSDAKPSRGNYSDQAGSGNSGNGTGEKVLSPEEQAELRRFDGDVLWGSGDNRSGDDRQDDQRPLTAEERLRAMTEGSVSGSNSGESIDGLLKTESFANGKVVARPDLKFLLINGTNISCTLIPRIVTDYPADISCQVNRDVYSADGSLLLIAKGSVARGQRRVAIKPGQSMVFAAWGTIETTDGLRLSIDSMSADGLGAAGINAVIDNHYGQRFGGAVLLSFLDDVFEAVAKNNSNRDGMNFDNSTQNAQDMAAIALENSINIAPTGYVEHAKELNIIVARDVDFRSIYGVN